MSLLQKLSELYSIEFTSSANFTEKGYRNKNLILYTKDKKYNLVIFKSESNTLKTIKDSNTFYSKINSNIICTRELILTKNDKSIITFKNPTSKKYACLYCYVEGETIDWSSWSKAHLKELGSLLAKIHSLKVTDEFLEFNKITDIELAHLQSMIIYFNNANISNALKEKLNLRLSTNLQTNTFSNIKETIFKLSKSSTNHILHMDLVRGNILWQDKFISGIIDAEKTSIGSNLFEIARTLAFLIVDCKYKSTKDVFKYFYKKGYLKKYKDNLNYKNEFNNLINFYLMYDFYKFLLHNPYESLEQNEHFVKTVTLLKKLKIII